MNLPTGYAYWAWVKEPAGRPAGARAVAQTSEDSEAETGNQKDTDMSETMSDEELTEMLARVEGRILTELATLRSQLSVLTEETSSGARTKAGKLHDYANMRDWQVTALTGALKALLDAVGAWERPSEEDHPLVIACRRAVAVLENGNG